MKKELEKLDRLESVLQYVHLVNNKDKFYLLLDNDETKACLKEDHKKYIADGNYEYETICLKECLGWDDGVFLLLAALGIECESV